MAKQIFGIPSAYIPPGLYSIGNAMQSAMPGTAALVNSAQSGWGSSGGSSKPAPVAPPTNVPVSTRPKASPAAGGNNNPFAVASAGWANIGNAANNVANSANSGFGGMYTGPTGNAMASGANSYQNTDGGGGNSMNGNSYLPVRAPQSSSYVPYAGQGGINLGMRQRDMLERGFMQAPQDVANGINGAFDQYQHYTDKAANRDLIRDLMSGLGGLGGGGNRMQGFVDVNSGQAASLPGQTTNAITAQALSPQAIAAAAQGARGAQSAPASQSSAPMTGGQASEVDAIAQQAARSRGAQNSNSIERSLTADSAQLQRAIEMAKAKQGIGNAGFLAGLNQDNAQYSIGMKAPLIKALMSGLQGLA